MTERHWTEQLEDAFLVGEVVGGNLNEVFACETNCEVHFKKGFHGYHVLMDSFQSLFLEALKRSAYWLSSNGYPSHCERYWLIYCSYQAMFRQYRACANGTLQRLPILRLCSTERTQRLGFEYMWDCSQSHHAGFTMGSGECGKGPREYVEKTDQAG